MLAYSSQTLLLMEIQYPFKELGALPMVSVMDHNRHYLFGRPFSVLTTHHLLCYLHCMNDPSNRITTWIMKLQEYDYMIVYLSGQIHH